MTTKAQAQAEQVASNRKAAYFRKVGSLLGHLVYNRVPADQIGRAFAADQSAEAFAATIAAREPVGAAVHPRKAAAVERAEADAKALAERVYGKLVEAGWDLNAAAPHVDYRQGREAKARGDARRALFSTLVTADESVRPSYKMNAPYIVRRCEKHLLKFIDNARRDAAADADDCVVKLVKKLSDGHTIVEAKLEGDLWHESYLRVFRADGNWETWKTQQIVNYSSLGTPYNQWPTRQVKG